MALFRRIDHVEIVTADAERAVRFYTEVLGFSVRARDSVPSPLGPLQLVYLDLGGTTVELMCYPDATLAPALHGDRLGYRMLALEVADMDAALAELKKHGVQPSWGPKKRPAYARAEIRDPDGNGIELRQWIEEEKP